ncbi:hypothetical protein [Maribacter halichondriae]|uniref:hypothetical protein n=1 Tax=Maribacter halichondriae TaxID=2980554 RepID=UPI002359AD78|nr:hypothetical protein [Maribacter sp. Hal144]
MKYTKYIFTFFFLVGLSAFSQVHKNVSRVQIKGSVKGKENLTPIPGVEITTPTGAYAITDGLGEFKIEAPLGEVLIFQSPEFKTVRHRITSDEDIDVLVQGYSDKNSSSDRKSSSKRAVSMHKTYLDSANYYKRTDIAKSIDFITQSIAQLGKQADKKN